MPFFNRVPHVEFLRIRVLAPLFAVEYSDMMSKENDLAEAEPVDDPRRRLILEGPIRQSVLKIALPSVATMLLQTLNSFLDRFFVGHLEAGPEAQTALTFANSLMFLLMSAAMALSVGTTALVARSIGEGNRNKHAEKATEQSLMLAVLLSLCIGLPMYFLRVPLLGVMGLQDTAHDLAKDYLGVTLLGLPTTFLMFVLSGAFRGMGDTVRPLWVSAGANVIHALLNYLLLFGNFGFPRMGLPGGALALAISQACACMAFLFFLKKSTLSTTKLIARPEPDWLARLGKIGYMAALQQVMRVGSMIVIQGFLAHSPSKDAAVAALGIGLTSESIAFMPGIGYSIAASAFVGQNLGAKQPDRASAGAWGATYQAILVMSVMGVLFYFGAAPFVQIFFPHLPGETVERAQLVETSRHLTVLYLKAAAWSEPFLALNMVLTGALQGAGDTKMPTVLTTLTLLVLRVPLCYFLLPHYGPVGVWWAFTLSTILNGILTVIVFNQGHWKRIRV
jgi:putative MATE family efflux protein